MYNAYYIPHSSSAVYYIDYTRPSKKSDFESCRSIEIKTFNTDQYSVKFD